MWAVSLNGTLKSKRKCLQGSVRLSECTGTFKCGQNNVANRPQLEEEK